ncbi:MAG: hypothetical protein AB1489_41770 [Acidobacteriota bacterium]
MKGGSHCSSDDDTIYRVLKALAEGNGIRATARIYIPRFTADELDHYDAVLLKTYRIRKEFPRHSSNGYWYYRSYWDYEKTLF